MVWGGGGGFLLSRTFTTLVDRSFVLDVSKKAEEIEPDESDCTEEPCTLVRLAKRNVMFLLVIIALLTLTGWIN